MKALIDDDYILTEGAAWLDVKGFSVRIHSTDEGVVVDIYDATVAKTGDFDLALITSAFAFDHECNSMEVDHDNISN